MSVKTTTVYNCDYCQKQLPDDYATTNGEGKGYYVKKAHDTIPLDTPIAGCTGIVVEVTLGTPKDDHHFTDLCDDCRLKFLKMAVEHLERKVRLNRFLSVLTTVSEETTNADDPPAYANQIKERFKKIGVKAFAKNDDATPQLENLVERNDDK